MPLNYIPWRGESYSDGFRNGRRLLILGHSHYQGNTLGIAQANDPEFTKTVIKDHINNGHLNFLTYIEKILNNSSSKPDQKQRTAFWNKVTFSNYFQEALEQPGVRPTDKQWNSAHDAFPDLLRILDPEIMFVFSLEVWSRLPTDEIWPRSRNVTDDGSAYLWVIDDKLVFGGGFAHSRNKRVNRPIWHAWAEWLFRTADEQAFGTASSEQR